MDTPRNPVRVLVVGASGALGRPVVRALLERGVGVRGLCRHPEAAADLAAAGAKIVVGDLTDRASIERAFRYDARAGRRARTARPRSLAV